MGLVILGVLVLYLLISAGIVMWAASYAQKNKKNAKLWGGGAALVMYLLVFWDHIPTVVAHKYYCETEAGFWIYKTVDEWKAENPGVMETLVRQQVPPHEFEGDNNDRTITTFWNSRVRTTLKYKGPINLNQWQRENELIDTKTNDVLARYIDFSTSQERRQAGWSGWKFWLHSEHCSDGSNNAIGFVKLVEQLKGEVK